MACPDKGFISLYKNISKINSGTSEDQKILFIEGKIEKRGKKQRRGAGHSAVNHSDWLQDARNKNGSQRSEEITVSSRRELHLLSYFTRVTYDDTNYHSEVTVLSLK